MALAFILPIQPALAHASLLESTPADGAVLATSPNRFTLRFNEPVAPTVFSVIDPSGKSIQPKSVAAFDEHVDIILAGPLPEGTSLLSYRIISADGHPVGGSISFSIGHPSASASKPNDANDPLVNFCIWLTRVGIYLGLFAGAGGAFFRSWIDGNSPEQTWADCGIKWIILVGLFFVPLAFGLQGLDSLGLHLSSLLAENVWSVSWSTTYAATLSVVFLTLASAFCSRCFSNLRLARLLSFAGLVGVGVALALSGHASTAAPQLVTRPAVFLHGVGIAFWAGALLPLMAAANRERSDYLGLLHRFASLATPAVAMIFLAGFTLAAIQVERFSSLWETTYGKVLVTKLCFVTILFGLATMNRLILTPAVADKKPDAIRRLAASMLVEAGLMVAIFCVAATWRFTPPPRALLQADAQPAHIHMHTEKALVDLTLSSGQAGPVVANLYFQSGDFGPLEPREVSVLFSRPEAGIEPFERTASLGPDGIWRTGTIYLPQAGEWIVRVDALISDFEKVILEAHVKIQER